jgi:PKD repeat protein
MKFLYYLFLLSFLSFFQLAAQHTHDWCYSGEILQQSLANPETRQKVEQSLNEIAQIASQNSLNKTANVRYIPVVVHVVYATEEDNISIAQIEDGIRILNEDFRRLNADTNLTRPIFQGVAADIEIEFRLAKRDPQGNCTDGITRTQSARSLSGTNSVKDLINWDNDRYYNIWVTRNVLNTLREDGGAVLGYSSFPQTGGNFYRNDGTVMRHDEFGSIGTSVADGRTLTHETGHYLALLHPFEDNAGGNVGGCNRGDFCDDTPPVDVRNFGCNLNTNSCSNDNPDLPDQIENYMDYASCMNMFTADQKARMQAVLNSSNLRGNLVSSGNLVFTRILSPPACTPEAIIGVEKQVVCVNEPVQFTDLSEEGEPNNWTWSFPGGNPASSSAENPTVSYSNPGVYNVNLTVGNSAGSDNTSYQGFIHVKNSANPAYNKLWVESFENGNQIPSDVTVIDGVDNNTFEVFTGAGSHGNQSLKLQAINDRPGAKDEIISPAINTAGASNLNLFFDYAFARRNNDDADRLEVFVSTDCGDTWIRRRFYTATRLSTGGISNSAFIPNSSQWQTEVINMNAYAGPDPVLIKFVFENGGGNSFYIDNIRLGEGNDVGMNEHLANDLIRIYPNPSEGLIFLERLSAQESEGWTYSILDISGRKQSAGDLHFKADQSKMELNLELKSGIYLLEALSPEGLSFRQKLLID